MKFDQKKVDAITALPGAERYSHFVKVAADLPAVWGLYRAGWALARDADGKFYFPLWPAEPYAAQCALAEWAPYEPREIPMDEIFDELIPGLKLADTGIAIFPTPGEKGTTPELDVIEADLRFELSRIE